jgi:hypothetical protein
VKALTTIRRLSIAAIALGLSLSVAHAADLAQANFSLRAWPRMTSPAFGCWMEKALGHRDAKFNCDLKNLENIGDPCTDTDPYYEGPKFPEALVTRVHPLATRIDVDFEHGDLRMIIVELAGEFSDQQVRKALGLPDEQERVQEFVRPSDPARPLIMSMDVHSCGPGITCLMIQAFDHMGAGDVDCGKNDEPRKP